MSNVCGRIPWQIEITGLSSEGRYGGGNYVVGSSAEEPEMVSPNA